MIVFWVLSFSATLPSATQIPAMSATISLATARFRIRVVERTLLIPQLQTTPTFRLYELVSQSEPVSIISKSYLMQIFRSEMRVSTQHFPIAVPSNQSHLLNRETRFKKSACCFVTKIMKM